MLTRWDPFRDMMSMRQAIDRLIDNSMGDNWDSGTEWSLPLDVMETGDGYVVEATVPGIKPEDLEITYNNGTLTIRGETKAENEQKEGKYHLRERRYGTFVRSIALPTDVKADSIEANYKDGVLSLKLPKTEEVKPKRIAIKGSESKMIEGKTNH
ncbi:MAG TPA: Hsp20/alpha crystallin family protein [Anaerolineaceae bacterium]